MKFNRDSARRAEIIGIADGTGFGGVKGFKGLSVEALNALVAEGFVDVEERQNSSPSVGEFLAFMREWPEVKAHGYVVSPDRDDYRVSLEGVECDLTVVAENRRDALRQAFCTAFHLADEFVASTNTLFAWWD